LKIDGPGRATANQAHRLRDGSFLPEPEDCVNVVGHHDRGRQLTTGIVGLKPPQFAKDRIGGFIRIEER
jgi:hypothetical protein